MSQNIYIAVAIGVALTGCATPRANHIVYEQSDPRKAIGEAYDTYQLPKSIITIQREKKGETFEYPIILSLAGDTRYSLGIKPVDRFGVSTDISLTKIQNTPLIQSVSVSLEDKRTEYIASAFKLLTTVALAATGSTGIFLGGTSLEKYPVEVDTLSLLEKASCGRQACQVPMLSPLSSLSPLLAVGEVPSDAIDVSLVLKDLDAAGGIIFSSACRRASIRMPTDNPSQWVVTDFALADPRYLQVIPLPAKGAITFHSQCGASVVSENVELKSDADVADSAIEGLIKLVKAIKKKDSGAEGSSAEGSSTE